MQKRVVFVFLLFTLFDGQLAVAQGSIDTLESLILQPTALQEDFHLLRRVLTETHPGLYRYTSRESMNRKIDSLSSMLGKPMAFYDFYAMTSALIADIRCAHTHVLPTEDLENYYLNNIKSLPYLIFYIDGKYFVTVNGTRDTMVKPGFELLRINNQTMRSVRTRILRHIWADGYNETLKTKTTSEAFFPLFYYLFVERGEVFQLTFKDLQGKEIVVSANAQKFSETQSLYLKNEVNREILKAVVPRNRLEKKKGWRLEIRKNDGIGVLRINGFGGGNSEQEAKLKMRSFLENCMKKLDDQKVRDLIIDLRHNGGGWDIQGVELFTYLMKEPARCYKRLHSISDSTEFLRFSDLSPENIRKLKAELKPEEDGTFSVIEEFSEQLRLQQPKPNRFKGRVYILANGGSASTTSEFIAYAKSTKTAIVIGEEAGGAYEGGNGGSFMNFRLPHSGFSIGTPLLYYENQVNEPELKGRGTIPDYPVPYVIEDIVKGIDTQLNFTLELIKKTRVTNN